MKFFALLILPPGTDITSEEAVRAAVEALMWPYRDPTCVPPEYDPPYGRVRWDYYLMSTVREWLAHYGYDAWGPTSDEGFNVVRTSEIVPKDFSQSGRLGEADVVTPEGAWVDYDFHGAKNRETLQEQAAALVRSYHESFAVLLFCHG